MKTALYICGLLKTFEHTVDSINRNLIIPNNCDVFVCVWDELGISKKHSKVSNIKVKNRPVTLTDIYKFRNVVEYDVIPYFEECTDAIDDVKVPANVKKKNPIHYYSSIPLSYMVKRCHELHSEKYNRIIKIRPDLKIIDKILVDNKFKDNKFYSSNHKINTGTQVSDKFVVGTESSMNHYCSLFDHLNSYWKDSVLVGERLLKKHMSKYDVKYFKSNVRIVRENLIGA